MVFPAFKYTSPEAYLEMEWRAFEKHEYIGGEIVAMAGATERHNMIVLNIAGEIRNLLKGNNCKAYPSDFRVSTPLFDTFMYPDVTIVCGETDLKENCFDTLANPSVIIEVISPSTEERDRVLKFFFYRQIPSFREYILVETDCCKVTAFRKLQDGTWESTVIEGIDNNLYIESIKMQLPMKEIYALTVFG